MWYTKCFTNDSSYIIVIGGKRNEKYICCLDKTNWSQTVDEHVQYSRLNEQVKYTYVVYQQWFGIKHTSG